MDINTATINILRPIILNKLFALPDGMFITDETLKKRDLELASYKLFMDTLTESQRELYRVYEDVSSSAWTSEEEDYFLGGFLSGVQTSIGLDPSVIIKLIQTEKAVS